MPFRFYNYERLSRAAARLREERWEPLVPIRSFAAAEDGGALGAQPPARYTGQMQVGDYWQGYDRWLWLRAEVELPAGLPDRVWGRFCFGTTNGGATQGFESLLYVNGEPWQAVDQNHQETPLPREGKLCLEFRLWSGLTDQEPPHPVEHKITSAALALLDENADSLYYWLSCLLEAHSVLPDDSPDKPRI